MTHKISISIILFSTLLAIQACSEADKVSKKLDELDEAVLLSDEYSSLFEKNTESMRREYDTAPNDSARWEAASRLFLASIDSDTDAALAYLNTMLTCSDGSARIETSNRIFRAFALVHEGEKEKAEKMLEPVRGTPDIEMSNLLVLEKIYRLLDNEQERLAVIDSVLAFPELEGGICSFLCGERDYSYNDVHSALDHYRAAYEKSGSFSLKADAAYRIATIHDEWQDHEMVKYWLAEASICHLRTPDRSTTALYNLVLLLFEEKDFERASTYMHYVIENAIISRVDNASIMYSLNTQQAINNALEYNRNTKIQLVCAAVCILGILLLVILRLLFNARRDGQQLNRSRLELSETNRELEDANLIKDNYLFRYMQLSLKYLRGIEDYRHQLRVVLREKGSDELKRMLRTPADSVTSYAEFYNIFDEIFLKLYPDFIEKVNELVSPEERFDEKTKKMNTRLRILAAIRLGLTDSGQIAQFLNCAPTSVYSYRSRIKHNARCKSEEFENQIKNIS